MTARSSDPISQPRRQWLAACIVALATGDTRAQGRTARLVVGFGPGGDGHVRFALIENEQRIGQAVRNLKKALTRLQ